MYPFPLDSPFWYAPRCYGTVSENPEGHTIGAVDNVSTYARAVANNPPNAPDIELELMNNPTRRSSSWRL